MDVNFQNRDYTCLNPAVCELHSSEQTQEIRLTEGMPDVGRILSAWGQPILRSKEWGADTLNYTGGMMVWVLYAIIQSLLTNRSVTARKHGTPLSSRSLSLSALLMKS